jgi:ABC-type Fe3+ transport system substrate-binding protein
MGARGIGRLMAGIGLGILLGGAAKAADLPMATIDVLGRLGLTPAAMDGVGRELAVPLSWIDGARKEGKLRIYGTWEPKEEDVVLKPFLERYPFIDVTYTRATRQDRSIRPLVALKQGRVLVDVVDGLGSNILTYRQAGALMALTDLPGFQAMPDNLKDVHADWIGHQLNYWCTAYNRSKLAEADMPATWEGFLDGKKWGNRRIGIGNRPNLWLLPLSSVKGEAWAEDYARKLFADAQPQLRKEGMNAMLNLVAIGEFDVAIPVAQYRLGGAMGNTAAVGWHCPDPLPTTVQAIGVIKQTPNPNAAKLYVNWLLSREGQVAQYDAVGAAPAHPALQSPKFLPFGDQLAGKQKAFRSPELISTEWPELRAYWNKLWEGSGGRRP